MNDAELCRKNGWTVGMQLVGDEGHGPTVIQITAVGEESILAKGISHNGINTFEGEGLWTLSCREWKLFYPPNVEVHRAGEEKP